MAQILTGTQVFKVVVDSTPMKRMVQDVDKGGVSTSKQLEMKAEIDANNAQIITNKQDNVTQSAAIAANTTLINTLSNNPASNEQVVANTATNIVQDEQIAINAAMNVTQNSALTTLQDQVTENAEHNDEIEAMNLGINSSGQAVINNVNMDGGVF
jgi:hypothetical protein